MAGAPAYAPKAIAVAPAVKRGIAVLEPKANIPATPKETPIPIVALNIVPRIS
jgi:hypothetical protein